MAGKAFLILVTSSDENLPVKASTPNKAVALLPRTCNASLSCVCAHGPGVVAADGQASERADRVRPPRRRAEPRTKTHRTLRTHASKKASFLARGSHRDLASFSPSGCGSALMA